MLRNKEKARSEIKKKTHSGINFEKAHAGIKKKSRLRNIEKKHTQE